ncbi:Potassium uptake protein, integral membrane component, KtrB [Serinicoccus hydrothermalis]|uniref:Potassium uptake protein, integral membrane component, KtrB n=1 Tax=Serinicoccus hydrothermalis TaxID=1758689 RepID=A0A1B1NG82_9MICO|nr:potassium transporter TrkG [Serinicoccus hydrothermalis]ANS80448.1 Potassium uptake protein, integral membrane component, KtrB [Serinicoccus hydrothermalis]
MRVFWAHPARSVTLGFLGLVVVGTTLLLLPVSRAAAAPADALVAAFTTVSATCVTGLITVDTGTYWTPFGQVVILALIQIGGFGVMTLATLLAMAVRGKLGLRSSLAAQADSHSQRLGEVRAAIFSTLRILVVLEIVVALVLAARFHWGYGYAPGRALWHGVFHAISAVNNAGFALYPDSATGFVGDIFVIGPICFALVVGGLGFPVLRELLRRVPRERWSVHTRLTLWGTAVLIVLGTGLFWWFETRGGGTLTGLDPWGQFVGALGGGLFPRTAGFNSIDYGMASDETLAVTIVLMFIGGGSAGTAGGVKITTFLILAFVIWSEVRGEPDVVIGRRRISSATQRQALSVALLAVGLVVVSAIYLMSRTEGMRPTDLLFETVSAFATVGLSTGLTASLPWDAQLLLMLLMFLGRVGPITVAAALALNTRHRHYRLPEERPVVG